MDAVLQKFVLQTGSRGQILAVPGILAFGQDQLHPLMPVFERYNATVTGVNYGGTRFSASRSIAGLRQLIEQHVVSSPYGQRAVVFASSLGGVLVAKTLMDLHNQYGTDRLNEQLTTIIVDSPASNKDLVLAPFLPRGINPRVGKLLQHFTPSVEANKGYGKRLLDTFRVPPKDGEIELVQGGPTADEIKQMAIHGLSGHAFTVWYDQLRWMLNMQLDLSGLKGLDVVYVACTANNMTIRQPQALKAWAPYVYETVEVATPHCAYLQAQPTWTEALTPLMDSALFWSRV